MKNKIKKNDKIIEINKNLSIMDKNLNYSSTLNLKKNKSPTNKNSIIEKAKPILNRFNRHNHQKEKVKDIKEDTPNIIEKKYREYQTRKINQTIDKEPKNKNIYEFTRLNLNFNSFLSSDGLNSNDIKKENNINNENNNKNEKEININPINNNKKLEKNNNNNNNIKLNNINFSKLVSYNSKIKNQKENNIENNNNIDNNNNNNNNNNNLDVLNMKSISIKRRHNYSKLIDKIKQNNNLINRNKNKTNKDNKEIEDKDNINNNTNYKSDIKEIKANIDNYVYHKDKLLKNIKDNNEKINNNSQINHKLISSESPSKNININNDDKNKDSINEISSFISHNRFINWTTNPKQSFQFLIHQASKNRDLSNSFHKCYESNQIISRGTSQAHSEIDEYSMNSNTDEQSGKKHKFRNLSLLKSYKYNEGDSFSSLNTNLNENKFNSLTDRKMDNNLFDKNDINNIKVLNFNYNKNENNSINNNEEFYENNNNLDNNINNKSSVITNNIINNNVYNTTLNFYKISNISKSKLNQGSKAKALSTKNLIENDEIIYEDETNMDKINTPRANINNNNNLLNNTTQNISNDNFSNMQKEYSNYTLMSHSSVSSTYLPLINLEKIFNLENKFQILLDKINKYQICENECLDYILYFFNNKIYEEEIKIFKNKHNKNNFLYNIKIEILCFFLCYDISFSKNFNQAAILLKTIFNIIHSNFLIFISYVIYLFQYSNNIDENNYEIINNLQIIIKQELKIHLIKQDMNEYNILQIITNNSKNINNYYKMLIDNLYGQNYIIGDNEIKFPQCLNNKNVIILQNKLQNIISIFFFDAYRLLTNYNYNDLYEFFNLFLNRNHNTNNNMNNTNNLNNNIDETNYNNYNNYNTYNISLSNNNVQNSNVPKTTKLIKYLLPKIKKYYKYSLVLDLDETLICIKRDSNNNIKLNKNNLIALILRPGLLDFLHKMKQLYELILFSSGTSEYVSPIIKSIEKKEKYFEHILYRQHVTYDDYGNFFKNLNLLNRNVKNIIIVDDTYKNFKNHKLNGICIKPFYGDVYNDKNTLKILGSILYKIRYDADITGDIRISLNKEKNNMLYSQIANDM